MLAVAEARAGESQLSAALPPPETAERIVITATQRQVPALDVPASVSILTAERLAGAHVTTAKQIVSLVPAMTVVNSIGETFGQLVAVRGVATSGADIGLESTVGVTVDGVPLLRPNLALFDFVGIDRVEFLKGPQGTLFGTNTTAGLINILTRRPDFTPAYEVSATVGEREQRELRLSAGGALAGSTLAGRIDAMVGAVAGHSENPNTGNVYGGRHRQDVRGQLLWLPAPSVDVRFIADYLHHGGSVNSPVYRIVGTTGAAISALSGLPVIANYNASDLSQVDAATPRFEINDSAGASVEANWQTGPGQLTAIASYRSATSKRDYDLDNGPADLAHDPRDGERYQRATAELRFRGLAGPLDYLFGVYAARGLIVSRDSHTAGAHFESYINMLAGGGIPGATGLPAGSNFPQGVGILDVYRQRSTTLAAFTHHVIAVTDATSLTLGLRYTHEEKSLAADITTDNPGCTAAIGLHGPTLTGVALALQPLVCLPNFDPRYDGTYATDRDDGNWSGTAALSHDVTGTLTAYGHYSRGYKSGGFQLERSGMTVGAASLSQLAFQQETTDSFELGLKHLSMDGGLRASTALFHTAFDDYQFSYFTGFNRRTRNVPELVTQGVEVEAAYRIAEPFEISLSGIYQEVTFGDSDFPAGLTQLQGTTAPMAPRWIAVGTASYQRAYPQIGMTGFANVDVRWQSKANVGASATPSQNFLQDNYAVVGARLGAIAQGGHLRIELWARNLFNERAWSLLYNTTLQPGSVSGFVTDPRSAGITATLMW